MKMNKNIKSMLYYGFLVVFILLVLISAVFTATGTQSTLLSTLVLIFMVGFLVMTTIERIKLKREKDIKKEKSKNGYRKERK